MHDVTIFGQRLYFKFLNVNLGKNLGIDLGKFCGTGPWSSNLEPEAAAVEALLAQRLHLLQQMSSDIIGLFTQDPGSCFTKLS